MEDLPSFPCVIATPQIGVSTPAAFAEWDKRKAEHAQLTGRNGFCTMNGFSHSVYEWFSSTSYAPTGVPRKGWDRAEALLLDLVRTGIENDFESVVFPKYPAIREVKRALERSGAKYVSLSGSGSAVYGLFADKAGAEQAARMLNDNDIPAQATETLTRSEYWNQMFAKNS
jgi:4-diphosphocytidyl-2-C-methyl-D-erythritol kinase